MTKCNAFSKSKKETVNKMDTIELPDITIKDWFYLKKITEKKITFH